MTSSITIWFRVIDQIRKFHNAPVPCPTLLHPEQKYAHFCSEGCIVGYGTGALWDGFLRLVCCPVPYYVYPVAMLCPVSRRYLHNFPARILVYMSALTVAVTDTCREKSEVWKTLTDLHCMGDIYNKPRIIALTYVIYQLLPLSLIYLAIAMFVFGDTLFTIIILSFCCMWYIVYIVSNDGYTDVRSTNIREYKHLITG